MDERKYCSVCGAHELVKIGDLLRDGEMYKVYKCLACDSEISDYDVYLRKKKAMERAARKAAQELAAAIAAATSRLETDEEIKPTVPQPKTIVEQPVTPQPTIVVESAPIDKISVANFAAEVYKKTINSALELDVDYGTTVTEKGKSNIISFGTGTMLTGGYFLTNAHVVSEYDDSYKVTKMPEIVFGLSGDKSYRFTADLVYMDPKLDLALLKTDVHRSLSSVRFYDETPAHGSAIYTIGNSKGHGLCLLEGIVSDNHRDVKGFDHIMISAFVTNGNSGGPVFDAEGRLIGMVDSGLPGVPNMNYVIPVHIIKSFLKRAEEKLNLRFF